MDSEIKIFLTRLIWIGALFGVVISALFWSIDWGNAEESIEQLRILVTAVTLFLLTAGLVLLIKPGGSGRE